MNILDAKDKNEWSLPIFPMYGFVVYITYW